MGSAVKNPTLSNNRGSSMKKEGGPITNWQLHRLTLNDKQKRRLKKEFPEIKIEPMVFTGTVVEDKAGRWLPGFHMRSTLIVSIDRKKGVIETVNTVYKVQNEGNDIIPDMGNAVLGIFY